MLGIFVGDNIRGSCFKLISSFLEVMKLVTDGEFVFISLNRSHRFDFLVPEGIDIIQFPMLGVVQDTHSWIQYQNEARDFLRENNIDTAIQLGATMLQMYSRDKEVDMLKQFARCEANDSYGMSYVMMKVFMSRIYFTKVCAEVCDNFYKYDIDPQEMCLSRLFDFTGKNFAEFYMVKPRGYDVTIMPYYEYALFELDCQVDLDRKTDFEFGASAISPDRAFLIPLVDSVEKMLNESGIVANIYLQRPKRAGKRDKRLVDQLQYVYNMNFVKTTLIVPSYCHDSFSWERFVAAVSKGCVPLVLSDCCLDSISKLYPEVTAIIERKLLVSDENDIIDKIRYFRDDRKRRLCIEELKNAIASKHVLDIQWLKDRWGKLDGVTRR